MGGSKIANCFSCLQKYSFILLALIVSTMLLFPINHAKVMPGFSSSSNTSMEQTCLIQTINTYENESVIVHGSPQHLCSWQVTMMQGALPLLQFLDEKNFKSNHFLYIEQADNVAPCESRYVSIDIHSYPCSVGFGFKNLTIYLQGNLSISISETPTNILASGLPSDCQDTQKEDVILKPNVTSNNCYTMKRYDSIITCISLNASIMASHQNTECSLHFPSQCNATLSNREVFLECSRNEHLPDSEYMLFDSNYTYTALLVYPINTVSLNLSGNRIYKIEAEVLQELNHLQQLYLGNNHLEEIDTHLFKNLATLIILDITYNHLKILRSGTFHDLCNLEELWLSHNQINHLDIGTFQNLKNLKTLRLVFNKLTTLHPRIFAHQLHLQKLFLFNNLLSDLSHFLLGNFTNLKELDLKHNQLSSLQGSPFTDLNNLHSLQARVNLIHSLGPNVFKGLHNLIQLFLDFNQLETLPTGLFQKVPRLEVLFLQGNKLSTLACDIFLGLHNLTHLLLSTNQLTEMDHNIFKNTKHLIFLDLKNNMLSKLPYLKYLTKLAYLGLINNTLTDFNEKLPSFAKNAHMIVSQPEICECYTSSNTSCTALSEQSPYLTCERLLSNRVLQIFMWVIGISALWGNIFVLIWRKEHNQNNKVQSLLLSNLALSDLLMGVYMIIIASADIYYNKYFPMNAEIWRSSITCKIAGALSIASSEGSVFFVTMISIDRFICIKNPYSTKKLGVKSTTMLISILWLTAFALAITPSLYSGRDGDFYEISHVCIGLPLAQIQRHFINVTKGRGEINGFGYHSYIAATLQENISGTYFSMAVFLGLNCLCYLIILLCYLVIIRVIYKTARDAGRKQDMNEQIRLTLKVAAIVGTDFLCWFPIIILGILVQVRVLTLPASVVEWCVTFVLPINSAINPYLYTIANAIGKHRKNDHINQCSSQNNNIQIKAPDMKIEMNEKALTCS